MDDSVLIGRAAIKETIKMQKLLRLRQVIAPEGPLPISRSAWWLGVKEGRYPKPIKLGPRTTAWRSEDIEELVSKCSAQDLVQ